MSKKRIFFQDFLFENLPVDEQENPVVEINKLPSDISIANCVLLSFDKLLRMNHPHEWNELFNSVIEKVVCIQDDVTIKNEELLIYKDFYLKTYVFNLSCNCKACYIQ